MQTIVPDYSFLGSRVSVYLFEFMLAYCNKAGEYEGIHVVCRGSFMNYVYWTTSQPDLVKDKHITL